MYVEAYNLGYRELNKLGSFMIEVGGNSKLAAAFQKLENTYNRVGIFYDFYTDEIKIKCECDKTENIQWLYPEDLI